MSKAVQAHSTFLRDLQAAADTAALMARIFPKWKGDDAAPVIATPKTRGPAPAAARVLEMA